MATITAAAGGGNWNSGGTWVGGVAPTANDDAVLAVTSGNVTIPSATTVFCQSLTCTSYTGTLTFATTTSELDIGSASGGALTLSATMTVMLTGIGIIQFVSTSNNGGSGWPVTTAGKTMPHMTFSGAGGGWTLQDSVTAGSSAIITVSAGTFNTNNQTIAAANFYIGGSTARTITMGSSAISLSQSGGGNGFWSSANTNLTITANTATVTFTGGTGTLNLGGQNMNGLSAVYSSSCSTMQQLNGVAGLNNVTCTGGAIKTTSFLMSGNMTLTGTFTVNGNSAVNRIFVNSNTVGTARTISAGAVSASNVDFQDITGAGAGSWNLSGITGGSGDCGGNSGITFTTAATQTWSGTSGGNWSTNAWTSRVPLPQDDVSVASAFSASQTITLDMPRSGKSVSFVGTSGSPTLTPGLTTAFFGSLNLTGVGSMGTGSGTTLTFGGRSSYTITTAGVSLTKIVSIAAPSGTYILQSTLITTGAISVTNGTLDTNNQTITADSFTVSGLGANATVGSSTLNLTSTIGLYVLLRTSNGTMSMGAATVNIVNASSAPRAISITGVVTSATINYTVVGSTGSLFIAGSATFSTLNFSDASNARTLLFLQSTAVTFTGSFNVSGSSGKVVTIAAANSSGTQTAGTAATITKTSGVVNCDYLSIQDSTANGGASWYAGANSTNVSNNSGWFFQAYSASKFLELM